MPLTILFAVICLLGIFFFPVASFILGRINYKYLSFGILCFFWGLNMMMQSLSSYLGIWINDTTVCLFIDMMTGYLFAVSLTVYFRSNLSRPISKAVSGILAAVVVIAVGTAAVLHLSAAADMIVTSTYVNIIIGITAIAFMILLLSVQSLVENAVKHGVGMKEDGGTVTIASRETETAYEVIVSDDGVGFDTNEIKNDGRSHIGMENIRRRLRDMCNADVEITSIIGEGTSMCSCPTAHR